MKPVLPHILRLSFIAALAHAATQIDSDMPSNAADLFFNMRSPLSVNAPLELLQITQQQKIGRYNFGGEIKQSLGYDESYSGEKVTNTQLTKLNLKFIYQIDDWMTFYSKIYLDTAPLLNNSSSTAAFVSRLSNSRIVLSDGFITLGNLTESPLYSYFGQTGLPYSISYAPSDATVLTERLSQITQRVVSIGLNKNINGITINPELFLFNGDSKSTYTQHIPTYGINMISGLPINHDYNMEITCGWLSNLADTNGFQRTLSTIPGAEPRAAFDYSDVDVPLAGLTNTTTIINNFSTYGGFATSRSFEKIQYRVPTAALAIKLKTPHQITLSAAYSTALKSFDYRDLTYRNSSIPFSDSAPPLPSEGAHPSAWNIYASKKICSQTSVYTGIEASDEALALTIPKNRFIIGGDYKYNEFTKITLEIQQDYNYSTSTDALGPARADVNSSNPVHLDGDSSKFTYAQIPSLTTNSDLRGQASTSIVLGLKVKF